LFHKGDQRILDGFQNMTAEDVDSLTGLEFGIDTNEGVSRDDYDFEVSLYNNPEDFLGFRGKDLRIVGKGALDSADFTFEIPINEVSMEVEWVPEDTEEILKVNKKAQKPQFKDVVLELGNTSFGEGFSGDADAVGSQISEKVRESLMQYYNELWEGDINKISVMPVESFLPMIFLRYLVGFSRE
jgi:hypothetical protein